ncbi:unnamed protein product [Arabidopsis lyrata]|uniref:probable F-box protein At1g30780 n=1 Tax=Arabidopsis lyrata subsp. lyrata TaxID=81972 RepID=UPI000A29CADE|nr:probable F-box protein At1g30780 [Arabidopsis lyrata subsp. lyrata]CAH8254021.1 unnamed protein product [Arabidopsis lyrata]|eukprot:XP_020866682.1 probable F-box protein At1g30780 [Arabidopsis lyrata subsp. lyrata]
MKGKYRFCFCSSPSKLDPNPVYLKMVRLPAKFKMKKSHQKKLLCRVESEVCFGDHNEKDTNPSEIDSLPLDLKMAILTRLPAKSLTNLKHVSKMWSSIIRSRGFIDYFFSVSSTRSRFIVALSNGLFNKPEEKLIFLFSFSHEGDNSSLLANFVIAIPSVSFSSSSGSCESVHGFLSVTAEFRQVICNPSTEEVIKLPVNTRFVGYDPIDDQHKALLVQSINHSDHLEHKVLTLGGGGQGWRHIEGTTAPYSPISVGVCIDGFVYYGAYSPNRPINPVMVCFEVRSEKISFIKAPEDVVHWGNEAIFIEYKGKLASIVRFPFGRFHSFDLWILEDVEKHEWSKQTCVFPSSVWDDVGDIKMSFPGTNKAGEIIMAPKLLSLDVRPFYIFYYNVETTNVRRIRLLGIGDDEEFRRSSGFVDKGECHVRIAPQHVESIAHFKDPII